MYILLEFIDGPWDEHSTNMNLYFPTANAVKMLKNQTSDALTPTLQRVVGQSSCTYTSWSWMGESCPKNTQNRRSCTAMIHDQDLDLLHWLWRFFFVFWAESSVQWKFTALARLQRDKLFIWVAAAIEHISSALNTFLQSYFPRYTPDPSTSARPILW